MTIARIYRPARNAMQSGSGGSRDGWVLEFELSAAKRPDRLMGWVGSRDMRADQVRLRFSALEDAVAFAERHGIEHRVHEPAARAIKPKNYADNFHPDRIGNWTH